jgi:hypothetical protein
MSSVRLVTLLTSAFVITSAPGPWSLSNEEDEDQIPDAGAIGHDERAQHRAFKPSALIASNRQIISSEAARKTPRKHHGA